MSLVFWLSALGLAYVYVGYPLGLWLCSRLRPRPWRVAEAELGVSIVVAARNEAANLPVKLANLKALDYPAERREIIVVSDGSSDATDAIVAEAGEGVRGVRVPEPSGKAVALNHGVAVARHEVVVFTDARQRLAPDAVRQLVRNFADAGVGAVSGELMLGEGGEDGGLGLYWKWEKKIRQWEGASGSVIGATGALYAVRRELVPQLPAGTILDDVLVPMEVVRQGKRVVFEPGARAFDVLGGGGHEFRRKVRTLTGNYQLLRLAPWLLTGANPFLWRFVSHKLLRLLAPFGLVLLLISAWAAPGWGYRMAFGLQCGFYGAAALGGKRLRGPVLGRLANFAWSFLLLNAAAVVALYYFISGKRAVWVR